MGPRNLTVIVKPPSGRLEASVILSILSPGPQPTPRREADFPPPEGLGLSTRSSPPLGPHPQRGPDRRAVQVWYRAGWRRAESSGLHCL